MAIDAVVFDLDYTLAVTARDRSTLLAEASRAAGASPISREAYGEAHRREHAHETRTPIFAGLLDEREDDVSPDALADAYRSAIADALEPIDGVEGLLADLRERYRVGLLTNGPVRAQRNKLRTLGWAGSFDATVITGELDAGKPDPIAFESILEDLDVAPERTVYVGDGVETDVAGATRADLRAIQVRYPGGPDPDPQADAHIDRDRLVADLPELVEELD